MHQYTRAHFTRCIDEGTLATRNIVSAETRQSTQASINHRKAGDLLYIPHSSLETGETAGKTHDRFKMLRYILARAVPNRDVERRELRWKLHS